MRFPQEGALLVLLLLVLEVLLLLVLEVLLLVVHLLVLGVLHHLVGEPARRLLARVLLALVPLLAVVPLLVLVPVLGFEFGLVPYFLWQ